MKRDRNRAGSPETRRRTSPVQNGLESRSHGYRDRNDRETGNSLHSEYRSHLSHGVRDRNEREAEHIHRHPRHGEEQIPSVFER